MTVHLCIAPPRLERAPRLIIFGQMPGLNEIIDARRVTRGKYNAYTKMKAEWTGRIAMLARRSFPVIEAGHFAYYCYERDAKRDPSNVLGGAMKLIEDGLVLAGKLANDGRKQILSIRGQFFTDKLNPRVELVVFPKEES